jgi:hypothetical protein
VFPRLMSLDGSRRGCSFTGNMYTSINTHHKTLKGMVLGALQGSPLVWNASTSSGASTNVPEAKFWLASAAATFKHVRLLDRTGTHLPNFKCAHCRFKRGKLCILSVTTQAHASKHVGAVENPAESQGSKDGHS